MNAAQSWALAGVYVLSVAMLWWGLTGGQRRDDVRRQRDATPNAHAAARARVHAFTAERGRVDVDWDAELQTLNGHNR